MKNQYLKLLVMALVLFMICGCVRMLLGQEIDMQNALIAADLSRVQTLLDQGTDVNIRMHGMTPLMIASMNGNTSIVKLLLERGAEVNTMMNNGGTSLMLASAEGHIEIVKLLLANGADVNAQTNDGNTPLLYAVHYKHVNIAELLIAAGANDDALKDNQLLDVNEDQHRLF